MEKYGFEKLKEGYIGDLLEIYNYYVLNTTATFHEKPLTTADMKELVLFEDSKYVTYVIKEKEKICGYVLLSQHKKREALGCINRITDSFS